MPNTLTPVFTGLAGREQQRAKVFAEKYGDVVDLIAKGTPPAEEEIDALLQTGGRTVKDLEADVAKLVRRRELAGHIHAANEADREQVRITAAKAAAIRERDLAIARCANAMAPLHLREAELMGIGARAQMAKKELRDTAEPELHAKLAAIDKRRREVETTKQELARRLPILEENISRAHANVDAGHKEASADLEAATGRKAANAAELAKLEAELADLNREADRIVGAMLKP